MEHIEIMERLLGEKTRRPDITFYGGGRIDITSDIVRALGIQPGDVIDIARGKSDYYLYVRHRRADGLLGRHEAQCYPSKSGSLNFRAYSKRICSAVLSVAGGSVARIMAGGCVESDNLGRAVILIPQHNLESQAKHS